MIRKVLLFFLLIVFSSCIPTGQRDIGTRTFGEPEEDIIVPATLTLPELSFGVYNLKVGDITIIDGRRVEVIEISPVRGTVLLSVDGVYEQFDQTKKDKIVPKNTKGMRIQIARIDKGASPELNRATFDFRPFKLGENEVFMFANELTARGDYRLTFDDLDRGDIAIVTASRIDREQIRIPKGEYRVYDELRIETIEVFDDPQKINRVAILKLELLE